jgi:hypothetical protein
LRSIFVVMNFVVVSEACSVNKIQCALQGSLTTKPKALLLNVVLNILGKHSPSDGADCSWEPPS